MAPVDRHQINIRDPDSTLRAVVGAYRSAKYTRLQHDVGDFEVVFPLEDTDVVDWAIPNKHVEFVFRNAVRFGGIIQKRRFYKEDKVTWVTISGPSWIGLLNRRIVNVPGGQAYDSYASQHPDDLIKNLVRNHMTSAAIGGAARAEPNFVVQANSTSKSQTVHFNGRYEYLLEAIQAVVNGVSGNQNLLVGPAYTPPGSDASADFNTMTFEIERNASGILEFRTWPTAPGASPIYGQDRSQGTSNAVVFDVNSGTGIANVEYIEDGTPVKNVTYGGGAGDGAARMVRVGFDSQSVLDWGRIEDWLDSSGSGTTDFLDLEILKHLSENSRGVRSLTFKIGSGGRYQYGTHFNFGDRVSAIWSDLGLGITDVIRGITVTLAEGHIADIELSIGAANLNRLQPGKAFALYLRALKRFTSVGARH